MSVIGRAWLAEGHKRRAPPAGFRGGVAEALDKRRTGENGPDHLALDADPTPMDNPQGLEAEPVRFAEVLLDDRLHVAWRNGVKVEDIGNRNSDRFAVELIRHKLLLA